MARYELQQGEQEIMEVHPSTKKLVLLLVCTVFLYLPWFIVRLIQNRCTKWVLTNRRLISMSGVFNQTTVATGLERVQDVRYTRTFWDRIIGTGSLEVDTASEQGPVHIGFLSKDKEFRDAMTHTIEARQSELRERSAPGGL